MAEATSGTQIVGAEFAGCAARRAVLLGLASAGAATLAACGGDEPAVRDPAGRYDTTTQTPSESDSAAPPSANAPAPGGEPAQPPAGAPAAGANNLIRTASVPVGGGVVAGKYVVVQPQAGVFRAFDASCPHAGVTVDAPKGGVIYCSGHGSKFRANDGSRISGPAERGLKQVPVKVQGGFVTRA